MNLYIIFNKFLINHWQNEKNYLQYYSWLKTVDVAQLVRALVCGTRGRGFESHLPPHHKFTLGCSQAVRHQTLTLACGGSNPPTPAKKTWYKMYQVFYIFSYCYCAFAKIIILFWLSSVHVDNVISGTPFVFLL